MYETVTHPYWGSNPELRMVSVTSRAKEKRSLKAKRSWLVRVESRRYASNFCKAAQTS